MLNKFLLIFNFSLICYISSINCIDGQNVQISVEKPFDYSKHQFIRIFPKKAKDLVELKKLKDNYKIDFWNPPYTDMRPILTLVSPNQNDFLSALNKSKIDFEVKAKNFQKVIDFEKEENDRNRRKFRQTVFDYDSTFHKYEEISSELIRITKNNSKCVHGAIGKSYEGRQIQYVIITDPEVKNKNSVILECGIHAREWASTSTCLWIINDLLTNSQSEPLLQKYEFVIIPTLNPDGYVYTHTYNRMWRKTRSPQRGGNRGADPNRNWDSHFGEAGSQKEPSGEAYCGSHAFSEIETKSMANFILSKKGTISAYFAIHAYSQLWMYPYGYTSVPPPNYAQLEKLSTLAVDAIRATNGLEFKKGTIARTIYKASGSSIDWGYDKAGIKVVFALELRDKGQYGFILPPHHIKPTAIETWNGIKAVVNNL